MKPIMFYVVRNYVGAYLNPNTVQFQTFSNACIMVREIAYRYAALMCCTAELYNSEAHN